MFAPPFRQGILADTARFPLLKQRVARFPSRRVILTTWEKVSARPFARLVGQYLRGKSVPRRVAAWLTYDLCLMLSIANATCEDLGDTQADRPIRSFGPQHFSG